MYIYLSIHTYTYMHILIYLHLYLSISIYPSIIYLSTKRGMEDVKNSIKMTRSTKMEDSVKKRNS